MYALAGFLRNSENKISYDHILFVESVEYNLQSVESKQNTAKINKSVFTCGAYDKNI